MSWKNILRKGDAWEMEQEYGMRGDQIVEGFSREENAGTRNYILTVISNDETFTNKHGYITGEDPPVESFDSLDKAKKWAEQEWKTWDKDTKDGKAKDWFVWYPSDGSVPWNTPVSLLSDEEVKILETVGTYYIMTDSQYPDGAGWSNEKK